MVHNATIERTNSNLMSQKQESDFDPYYTWLGIPPDDQPANHYRLLGVLEFENDANVIAVSADRQMVHVKAQSSGRYAGHSQSLC